MKTNIYTFDECLQEAQKTTSKQNHLILGNGFSVALFPSIFNYKTLADGIESSDVKNIFKQMNTNDFEFVLSKFKTTLDVLKNYPDSSNLYSQIKKDSDALKNTLIRVISKFHPSDPNKITEEQYFSCYQFLKNFDNGKKYTFNYDLVLYWVYMFFLNRPDNFHLEIDDGFRTPSDIEDQDIVTWELGGEHKQSLYYLHGALHLFNQGSYIEKYTWINNGKTLKEQIEESVNKNIYPLFIAEGSMEQKISRINRNAYLSRAFASLKSICGNLFIFGHSLRNEDDHVFNCINNKSKIKKIFISIFGDADSPNNKWIIEKIRKWEDNNRNKKEYFIYQAETAHVWDKTKKI